MAPRDPGRRQQAGGGFDDGVDFAGEPVGGRRYCVGIVGFGQSHARERDRGGGQRGEFVIQPFGADRVEPQPDPAILWHDAQGVERVREGAVLRADGDRVLEIDDHGIGGTVECLADAVVAVPGHVEPAAWCHFVSEAGFSGAR